MVKVLMFNRPEMVEFVEKDSGEVLYGIGFGDRIICGCCGEIFALNEVEITRLIPWIDITETIEEWS